MLATTTIKAPNRLLAALPTDDLERLLVRCRTVQLTLGEVLFEPNEPVNVVYFPTGSFISLMTPIDVTRTLEVGLVGDEGMVGSSVVLGVGTSPLRALVQGSGEALCIDAGTFADELQRSPALRLVSQRYLHVLMGQFAQTAGCSRFHVVEARLARWLLMTQDRAHSRQFHLTHELLAHMLGVRRVGVTKAATALQARNLIRYSRGDITVLNRAGLEKASCSCYAADTHAYARALNGLGHVSSTENVPPGARSGHPRLKRMC